MLDPNSRRERSAKSAPGDGVVFAIVDYMILLMYGIVLMYDLLIELRYRQDFSCSAGSIYISTSLYLFTPTQNPTSVIADSSPSENG